MSNIKSLKNSEVLQEEYNNGVIHLDQHQVDELNETIKRLIAKDGCMVEDAQERYAYNLLKNIILPTLDDYVKSKNPTAYEAYHGNMCRHASLIACHTLKNVLPDWEWNMYEITYSASIYNESYTCTHAFVVGERGNEYRAVDMWDTLSIQLYAPIESVRYPFEYDEIEKNRKIISMEKASYADMCTLNDEILLGNVPSLLKEVDKCIEIADALGILR